MSQTFRTMTMADLVEPGSVDNGLSTKPADYRAAQ
jgi:hypothetical protein